LIKVTDEEAQGKSKVYILYIARKRERVINKAIQVEKPKLLK